MKRTDFNPARRSLLKGTATLAAAPFVTTFGLMAARNAEAQTCERYANMVASPYGPVAPVNDQTTGAALAHAAARLQLQVHGLAG